jgi:hypothetical protein
LAVVHVVQWFHNYILLCNTTIVVFINPFQYVLMQRLINRTISRWIVILQEFELHFVLEKYKNSLVFTELILKVLVESGKSFPQESPINQYIFLIASSYTWYQYTLVNFHNLKCPSYASHDELRRIHHQEWSYLILDDTLYHRGVY